MLLLFSDFVASQWIALTSSSWILRWTQEQPLPYLPAKNLCLSNFPGRMPQRRSSSSTSERISPTLSGFLYWGGIQELHTVVSPWLWDTERPTAIPLNVWLRLKEIAWSCDSGAGPSFSIMLLKPFLHIMCIGIVVSHMIEMIKTVAGKLPQALGRSFS